MKGNLCEHGDELLSSINVGEFDCLNDYELLKQFSSS
jgi:hypothetical protein